MSLKGALTRIAARVHGGSVEEEEVRTNDTTKRIVARSREREASLRRVGVVPVPVATPAERRNEDFEDAYFGGRR